MSLPHRGLRTIVRNSFESFPPTELSQLAAFCDMMKQVEGVQQPIADVSLCDDDGHVHVIDHILDHDRRRHLPAHEGMVQPARSGNSLSAKLATDVQCGSSRQCQYILFTTLYPMFPTHIARVSFSSPMASLSGELGSSVLTSIGPY